MMLSFYELDEMGPFSYDFYPCTITSSLLYVIWCHFCQGTVSRDQGLVM